jgi:hypothetical protein
MNATARPFGVPGNRENALDRIPFAEHLIQKDRCRCYDKGNYPRIRHIYLSSRS